MAVCGAAGLASSRMLAVNSAKSASLAASRPGTAGGQPMPERGGVRADPVPDAPSRRPGPATQARHRRASWICWVNGPDSTTGQPCERISRAVNVHARVLVDLDVLVVPRALALTGRAAGRRQRRCHERPVHRVLVRRAGGGTSEASRMPATLLLRPPAGRPRPQAGAGTLMPSEDMGPEMAGS